LIVETILVLESFCAIIGAIVILIYVHIRKLTDKEIQKIKECDSEAYYQRFVASSNNTAAGIGFLFIREEATTEDIFMEQIERNIKATILELKIKNCIDIYNSIDGYMIKVNNDNSKVQKLKKSQIEVYEFLKKAAYYLDVDNKITIVQLSKFIKQEKNSFRSFVKQFNYQLMQEQKENGNYSEGAKKIYKKYKNEISAIFFAVTCQILFAVGDITISLIMKDICIERWILEGISIIFLLIASYQYWKMGTILYKTSFGLSLKGVKEYNECLGLKRFLEDYTLLKECTNLEEINIKEEFLVYAAVLGVSNKILDELGFEKIELERAFDFDAYSFKKMS